MSGKIHTQSAHIFMQEEHTESNLRSWARGSWLRAIPDQTEGHLENIAISLWQTPGTSSIQGPIRQEK